MKINIHGFKATGTTVATQEILQKKLADLVLLPNRGFLNKLINIYVCARESTD